MRETIVYKLLLDSTAPGNRPIGSAPVDTVIGRGNSEIFGDSTLVTILLYRKCFVDQVLTIAHL